jgi:superfamily II DNA or RNA helicase
MNLNFVYFASIQDLIGSESIGGNYDKNHEIFNNNWDFVVVDEGHEGTKTELGKSVLDSIIKEENKEKTYLLVLSGTPFNLLVDFEKESI